MIAEPTGTDGRPIICKKTSVTGRHDQPLFSFIYLCFPTARRIFKNGYAQ
jgi:hypothetical protein